MCRFDIHISYSLCDAGTKATEAQRPCKKFKCKISTTVSDFSGLFLYFLILVTYNNLALPLPRTEYPRKSFWYSEAKLWNIRQDLLNIEKQFTAVTLLRPDSKTSFITLYTGPVSVAILGFHVTSRHHKIPLNSRCHFVTPEMNTAWSC